VITGGAGSTGAAVARALRPGDGAAWQACSSCTGAVFDLSGGRATY
jgi:hypothetical protein